MLYKKEVEYKHELFLTGLVLLSVYLSLGESLVPKPFPWMKLGLANIATIIALEKFNWKMALEVVILRIFIQGIMLGTMFTPSFIISLIGGGVSTCGMIFLYRFRKYLSLVAISSLAAFIHNGLQLCVVYFLIFRGIDVNSKSVLLFVWIFLFIGIVSGGITGVIVEKIRLRRVTFSE